MGDLITIRLSTQSNISSATGNDSSVQSIPEWSMVELNGQLMLPASSSGNSDSPNDKNMELGSISVDDKGCPKMIIGSHELEGKFVELKKPLVVMRKRKKLADEIADLSVEYLADGTMRKRKKTADETVDSSVEYLADGSMDDETISVHAVKRSKTVEYEVIA
eukprot:CAMPEP_0194313304 /NCGR_PEP_ID=MMETSP0171-20130528/10191_1 /TAXON_ID=218684 /ORGANISM="Corethron pennatum, Strain L29A3" /LENGTH=162 /DNA_ID=CAMNT_0039068203 /DNA_START=115 /DNA_END=599 /DNA_ORIENTATION=+